MTIIRLILADPNDSETLEMWINPKNIRQMGKQIPKIRNYLKLGYKLKDVIGEGAYADFFRSELAKYNKDLENYRISVKDIVKHTLHIKKQK